MKKKIVSKLVARAISFTITLIGLGLIINLSRDISRLWRAGEQVKLVEEKAQKLKEEQQKLVQKKAYYQSEEFIEEEARNKLNMAKPDETVVILPPNVSQILGRKEETSIPEIPNWQRWWNLFF